MEIDNTLEELNPIQSTTHNQQLHNYIFNKKRKFLFFIGTLLIIGILGIVGYVFEKNSFSIRDKTSKNQTFNFETLELLNTNLNDSETELFFADANKVYKITLDGSSYQELASFPYNDITINILKDENILVGAHSIKYEKNLNKTSQDSVDYKQVSSKAGFWVIRKDTNEKEELDVTKYRSLLALNFNTGEKIYASPLPNGQAEILSDKLDGTQPTKIGLLTQKLITMGCEFDPCPSKEHPGEFYPSFDGSYLLNKPPGGGGLGQSAVVVSRDGSKAHEINFFWYVSSAMWIGNNQLLTKAQEGKQKIFTFNEDGTLNESIFEPKLEGYFSQDTLSPTKQYVLIEIGDPVGISLFDLDSRKVIPIEKEDREKLIQQYNFQDELKIDPRIHHSFKFLGWNKKGDKFAYFELISPFAETGSTEIREIKIYDVLSKRIYTVTKLHPHPKNPDEYLLQGKPVADAGQFIIR